MDEKNYSITIHFSDSEGQAFVKLLRRSNWGEIKLKASDELEAMKMESAVMEVTKALIDAGVPWTL